MQARKLNPELERLRQEVPKPPDIKTIVSNVIHTASQIHAAYLFENAGRELLQKLCVLLSGTTSSKSFGDWQIFASHLGLMIEQIRSIDSDFKALQGPMYYVLLAFVQSINATMEKIFLSLEKIDRLDIINRIMDDFDKLSKYIFDNNELNVKNNIYIPNSIPRAPLVLMPIIKNDQETTRNNTTLSNISNNIKNRNNMTKNTIKKCASIVMLTYADDGLQTANEATKFFRSQDPKIGVVILQEQEKHVFSRAEGFVEDCFKQVDYIVPILTEEYLIKIHNDISNNKSNLESNTNLDSKYVNYIFSLMRNEFVNQNCVNTRVRCIVPDTCMGTVLNTNLHQILQVWFKESDIKMFAKRIIQKKF